jgi:mRNA interferase MazF
LPGYGDYLVCGLSSQLHQYQAGFDEMLMPDAQNGLRLTSVIRLGFLDTLPASQIIGQLGDVPDSLLTTLRQRLADHITGV